MPTENKQLALRKAINAHEDAQGSLSDLTSEVPEPKYEEMLARIAENLKVLRAEAESWQPEDKI